MSEIIRVEKTDVACAALSGKSHAGDNNWIVYVDHDGVCGVCHKIDCGNDIELFDFYNFWDDLDDSDETIKWLVSDGLDFNAMAQHDNDVIDGNVELEFI